MLPLLLLLLPSCLALRPSPGCGSPLPHQPAPGHSHAAKLPFTDPLMGQVERDYRLHVPQHFDTSNTAPTPLLIDYHGWGGNDHSHETDGHDFFRVADEDTDGGFLLASGRGMGDVGHEKDWGSWNCSRTTGPQGEVCDTDRSIWGEITCYDSCSSCDGLTSCDWTTCYDDIAYTEALIDQIAATFCVDLDSVHQSGVSNGGMFSYFIASRTDRFASIGPVAGAPLLGFGEVPSGAISVIDFHGIDDDTIPYDLAHSEGEGPGGSLISWDGWYYQDKAALILEYATGLGCGERQSWETPMDGVQGWECGVHSGCRGGGEMVACAANYGHDYPFGPDRYIEGSRIMWHFMKTHPKQ